MIICPLCDNIYNDNTKIEQLYKDSWVNEWKVTTTNLVHKHKEPYIEIKSKQLCVLCNNEVKNHDVYQYYVENANNNKIYPYLLYMYTSYIHPCKEENERELFLNYGLKKESKFLDIGCFLGRLTIPLVSYLNKDNYYGFDKEYYAIDRIKYYINSRYDLKDKNPNLVYGNIINDKFNFEKITNMDFIYAYSVLTHLNIERIKILLKNIHYFSNSNTKIILTINEITNSKDIKNKKKFKLHEKSENNYLIYEYPKNFGRTDIEFRTYLSLNFMTSIAEEFNFNLEKIGSGKTLLSEPEFIRQNQTFLLLTKI